VAACDQVREARENAIVSNRARRLDRRLDQVPSRAMRNPVGPCNSGLIMSKRGVGPARAPYSPGDCVMADAMTRAAASSATQGFGHQSLGSMQVMG